MDVSEVFFTSAAASTFSSKGGEGRCLNFCQCLLQSMVPHQLYQCGPDLKERSIVRCQMAKKAPGLLKHDFPVVSDTFHYSVFPIVCEQMGGITRSEFAQRVCLESVKGLAIYLAIYSQDLLVSVMQLVFSVFGVGIWEPLLAKGRKNKNSKNFSHCRGTHR
nr:PREDICTED: uncharacterized protein LOC103562067 isoform X4 [Equus przewalskii]